MTLTFVEQVEGVQAGENRAHLRAQVLEAGRDVLIHREPADLLHLLVLPQQVGLHRHRHVEQNRAETNTIRTEPNKLPNFVTQR